MKVKKLVAILLTLILALGLLPMSAFSEGEGGVTSTELSNDSTASITITDAVENDEFKAYKVIDITYNSVDNTLTYAWNENFKGYFESSDYNTVIIKDDENKDKEITCDTVEKFAELKDDSDALKKLLSNLPQYIDNKSIKAVDETESHTVGKYKTAKYENLKMGEYFIRPTATTSVYQLMLQKVEPSVKEGKYVLENVTFGAKHKEVNVTKEADKTSITKGEKVKYTIKVDVPTYDTGAKDISFYVSDLLPNGLTIDEDTIKVKLGTTEPQENTSYKLYKVPNESYTFKLSVSSEQYFQVWHAFAGADKPQLIITYTATLKDDDKTNVNELETNTVTFDYSNYPYVENSHQQKTASVDVTTFGIKIFKYYEDKAKKEKVELSGATFDLYRTLTDEEKIHYEALSDNDKERLGFVDSIPNLKGEARKGKKLESQTTKDGGYATFEKYEANETKYDYYLVETKAPSGYNLSDEATKVNFSASKVEGRDDIKVVDENGYIQVDIVNNKGIILPITGGTGTVIFTIIGIALMLCAVVLLVVSRKKTKAKENK